MVLARVSGALTVLGVQDLTNMLGDSPEFLEGVPRISQCFQKGFFGFECDFVVRGRRPSCREESAGEDPDVELEVGYSESEIRLMIKLLLIRLSLMKMMTPGCLLVRDQQLQ